MTSTWKSIVTVLIHIFVTTEIHGEWWDDYEDTARIFKYDKLARIRDYPHMVSIVNGTEVNLPKLMCSGYNIGQYKGKYGMVLTAGSCLNEINEGNIDQENILISTNSEYWNCDCAGPVTYNIAAYRIHPNYKKVAIASVGIYAEHDVGLIILNAPWRGVYNQMAVKVPVSLNVPSSAWTEATGLAVGWGYVEEGEISTLDLRVAQQLSIIPGKKCKNKYYSKYFPPNCYCIETLSIPGKGPCGYDQGGPFIQHNKETEYYVLGLATSNIGCGSLQKPTIIVNTSYYTSFINEWSWISKHKKLSGSTRTKKN